VRLQPLGHLSALEGSTVGLAELFQDPLLAMLSLDCTGRNYFGANQGAIGREIREIREITG